MIDPRVQASYQRSMARNGQPVVVQRTIGFAPNATTISAHVSAIVAGIIVDTTAVARTGISARDQGSISQGDRMVMVLAADLAAQAFPLPIEKNDTIILDDGAGDRLNVLDVDAAKRHLAGAIDIRAVGVA